MSIDGAVGMSRTRIALGICVAAISVGLAIPAASQATACQPTCEYHVDSTADEVDATIGDLQCATASGACTLRAAVQEANANTAQFEHRIHLPPGTYVLTRHGAG